MEKLIEKWKHAAHTYEVAEKNGKREATRLIGRYKKEAILHCIYELERALAESSHESAALPLHSVSVNEWSEFLSVGVAVCPHFNECINNGKNEYCDLQTFQEIDCFIGQTER